MEALGLDEVWWLVSPGNPLKAARKDMASFEDRFASAKLRHAVRASASAISSGARARATRSTRCESSSAAIPMHRFIWLMGADTVAEFHQWKHWRKLRGITPDCGDSPARLSSPGPRGARDGLAERFVRPLSQAKNWTDWSAPAILLLRLPPDPTSATVLRAHDPNWHQAVRGPRAGFQTFRIANL